MARSNCVRTIFRLGCYYHFHLHFYCRKQTNIDYTPTIHQVWLIFSRSRLILGLALNPNSTLWLYDYLINTENAAL